jgi:hypothetical protein
MAKKSKHLSKREQVRRDSNPQPAVLETAALPIELLTYRSRLRKKAVPPKAGPPFKLFVLFLDNALLVKNVADAASPHGAATFANCETDCLFHRNRGD